MQSNTCILPATSAEFAEMRESLNQFRKTGTFCDVKLKVDKKIFPAHKFMLACHSAYFKAMFTRGFKESNDHVIDLVDLDETTVAAYLDYFYTMKLEVNEETVQKYLVLSERWGIEEVKVRCSEFIASRLTPSTAVYFLKFAQHHMAQQLYARIREYILLHFTEVWTSNQDFVCQLDAGDVVDLLKDDRLNAIDEINVLNVIATWINFNRDFRLKYIVELLRSMRLSLIDLNQLSEFINIELCIDNKEILYQVDQLLETAANLRLSKNQARQSPHQQQYNYMPNSDHPFLRTRIPRHIIFAIGGWSDGNPISVMETYDRQANRWLRHASAEDSNPRSYHGIAVFDNIVYIIGGFDGTTYYKSLKSFNPIDKSWKDLANMRSPRCYISTVACPEEKVIYACGGYNGTNRLHSAEKYSVAKNMWVDIASMVQCRSDAAAAYLKGRIFVAGGFNGAICLSSTEVLNPVADQWTLVSPMLTPRSGLSVVAHEEHLYVLGGFDGEFRLASCERYDELKDEWQPIREMKNERSNFAVCVMEDHIYAIGGFNGNNTVRTVERYNVEIGEWSSAGKMTTNRSALKACVLTDLANVREYSALGCAYAMHDEGVLSRSSLQEDEYMDADEDQYDD